MSKNFLLGVVCLIWPLASVAGNKPDIVVMSQNQYLGADLTPIIEAPDFFAYNEAVIEALGAVAANNLPERAHALAATIAERKPHLAGLQEVFAFGCIPNPASAGSATFCALFDSAFNDHLQATLDALDELGADYYVAGIVENLNIGPGSSFALPGLPVFFDGDGEPEIFITVLDRDVILARGDVATTPVPFNNPQLCGKPSADGCNYDTAASAPVLGNDLEIRRGFAGVDAWVSGRIYRFVNTHLEVQFPSADPLAPFVQAAQMSQLLATLSVIPMPPGTRTIVVGDINSSPDDPAFFLPAPPFPVSQGLPPYQQLVSGTSVFGQPVSVAYADAWNLRPGKPPGHTCCQYPDLSNPASAHDERIDVIFAFPAPGRVKANVLDNDPEDKTVSGLWPSDHSSVVARMWYDNPGQAPGSKRRR